MNLLSGLRITANLDILPWLQFGSTKDDPTSPKERLFYYTLDLNNGIQAYIFNGSKEELDEVIFDNLSSNEKEVYYTFLHIIFNPKYNVKLSDKNIQKLRDDGAFYREYFYQIQETLGVKQ